MKYVLMCFFVCTVEQVRCIYCECEGNRIVFIQPWRVSSGAMNLRSSMNLAHLIPTISSYTTSATLILMILMMKNYLFAECRKRGGKSGMASCHDTFLSCDDCYNVVQTDYHPLIFLYLNKVIIHC